jgi:hypothetical protein
MGLPRHQPSGKLVAPMQNQFLVGGGSEFISGQPDLAIQ